jgi:filamentous hemagglutinin family protein
MSFLDGRSFGASRAALLASISLLSLLPAAGRADGPTGGTVAQGAASIAQQGRVTTITQSSDRAVLDWQGFDVGADHSVIFDQPGRSAATLNRVTGGAASVIEGAITAPGTVVIQNGAGVMFTGTARVDVGGLVATSQIVDADHFFGTGNFRIGGGEAADARVVNDGTLTIGEAGLAALVGRNVENHGAIVAEKGTVVLASGTRTTIDMSGDGLFQVAVDGDPEGGGVRHTGRIEAGGGQVVLTAGGAAGVLDGVINTSGLIRASSASGQGGTITLAGRGGGAVRVSGALEARGQTDGGTITVTGETVAVTESARLDASGAQDGGSVLVGGEYKGGGDLRRAEDTRIASGAQILADGKSGSGGTVVVWADGSTVFDGVISAKGASGGGTVETSGRRDLGVGETARVETGAGGSWLLDPTDVVIANSGLNGPPFTVTGTTTFLIDADSIENALNAGTDVTVSTVGTAGSGLGDITVDRRLTWSGTGDLTLEAAREVRIDQRITSTGSGSMTFVAANDLRIRSRIRSADGDIVGIAGDDVRISDRVESTGSGDLVFRATGIGPGGGSPDIFVTADLVRASGSGDLTFDAQRGSVRVLGSRQGNQVVRTDTGSITVIAARDFLMTSEELASRNTQFYSDRGDIVFTVGDEVRIEGASIPRASGNWARLGRGGNPGSIDISAASVVVEGGATGNNNFAEIAQGGDVSITADTVRVTNRGSRASVRTFDGGGLSIDAPVQTWDGLVGSGNGARDGGDVALTGDITASVQPLFSLRDGASFVLGTAGPSSFTGTGVPLVVETGGTGASATGETITVDAPVTAPQITLISEEGVTLDPGASLTGTGPGDAIVIAGGDRFFNTAGTDVLTTTDPGARWLVYVDRLANFDEAGNLEPVLRGFNLYDRAFPSAADVATFVGNRIVYAEQPTLLLTADDITRPFGTTEPLTSSLAGLRPGDLLSDALASPVTLSSPGEPATAPVGSYVIDIAATASSMGYALDLVTGTLTVTGNPVPPPTVTPPTVTPPTVTPPGVPPTVTPAIDPVGDLVGTVRRLDRSVFPLTPGDATFRTTRLDAPLVASTPFNLTFSLGTVTQFVPAAATGFVPAAAGVDADTGTDGAGPAGAEGFVPAAGGLGTQASEGFVPAAGGLETGPGGFVPAAGGLDAATGCGGWASAGTAPADGCAEAAGAESYWLTLQGLTQ